MKIGEASLYAAVVVASYLLGSIPFGFIAARVRGIDITRQGSGNIGATNVLRMLGPAYAVPVLILDMGKGALAAYLGLRFLGIGELGALIAGAAAIAGHNWSVFLKFRGGKGVAATAGVVVVAFPMLVAAAAVVFFLTVAITRYVSLGSILAAWTAFFTSLSPGYGFAARISVFVLVVLITVQHRANIKRLLSGTENKLGRKASDKQMPGTGGANLPWFLKKKGGPAR